MFVIRKNPLLNVKLYVVYMLRRRGFLRWRGIRSIKLQFVRFFLQKVLAI